MHEPFPCLRTVRLGDFDAGRNNNLNLLRLVFASAVVFSHCYVLRGEYPREPMRAWLGWGDLGETAVFGFFFVSGYLIVKSALRTNTVEEFMLARALRIFPGLVLAILLCAFLLGPIVSVLPFRDYILNPQTFVFLRDAVLHRTQDTLPGMFEHTPIHGVVNGPIWTLPTEWTMYVATFVACSVVRWRVVLQRFTARSWMVLAATLLLTAQMMAIPWATAWMWIACFLLGSACYMLRNRIWLSVPVAVAFLAADLGMFHHLPFHLGARMFPPALCYCVLTFGYHPALHVRWYHRLGDYSYGLYIFGWPLQQVFATSSRNPLAFFAVTYPLVLLLAVCSWHFLEEPCLALKGRLRKAGYRQTVLQSSNVRTCEQAD